jgi:isopenicillin-N N-acyltransferase-like protein
MVTEADVIGKIGINSAGVGVCLNAIRACGVDRTKLPIDLAPCWSRRRKMNLSID